MNIEQKEEIMYQEGSLVGYQGNPHLILSRKPETLVLRGINRTIIEVSKDEVELYFDEEWKG